MYTDLLTHTPRSLSLSLSLSIHTLFPSSVAIPRWPGTPRLGYLSCLSSFCRVRMSSPRWVGLLGPLWLAPAASERILLAAVNKADRTGPDPTTRAGFDVSVDHECMYAAQAVPVTQRNPPWTQTEGIVMRRWNSVWMDLMQVGSGRQMGPILWERGQVISLCARGAPHNFTASKS